MLVLSSTARANYAELVNDPTREPGDMVGLGKESGEIEYADSEYGNCSASVAAEYTHVGALRAVCAEFAAGEAIPANALAEAERLDAAGVSWGGVK